MRALSFTAARGLLLGVAVALGMLLGVTVTAAQSSLPATEASAREAQGQVSVRVVGSVVSREGRLGARRSEARRQALARAKRSLHRWLDDRLARRGSSPALAERLHALLEREARVLASRPLVDGSIVLVVGLSESVLTRAGAPGLDAP